MPFNSRLQQSLPKCVPNRREEKGHHLVVIVDSLGDCERAPRSTLNINAGSRFVIVVIRREWRRSVLGTF
jgi:hypothetical protein